MERPGLHAEAPTEFLGIRRAGGQFGGQQAGAAQTGQSKPDTDGAGGLQKTATIHVRFHGGTSKKGGDYGGSQKSESNYTRGKLVRKDVTRDHASCDVAPLPAFVPSAAQLTAILPGGKMKALGTML